jgi:hypothetical protein
MNNETTKQEVHPDRGVYGMSCINCGGTMIGDGYLTVRHCEFATDDLYWDKEPDAPPVYCDFIKDDKLSEAVLDQGIPGGPGNPD